MTTSTSYTTTWDTIKQRAENEIRAEVNRRKHSFSKAEKRLAAMTKQRHNAAIDGARRERVED